MSTLQTLPNEILDLIFPYLDSKSAWRLSHSLRHFKQVSTAIYNTAQCVSKHQPRSHDTFSSTHQLQLQTLWPHFIFPWIQVKDPSSSFSWVSIKKPFTIHPHDLHLFSSLFTLIKRYNGSVTIPWAPLDHWTTILPILPTTINISNAVDFTQEPDRVEMAQICTHLAKANIKAFHVDLPSSYGHQDEAAAFVRDFASLETQSIGIWHAVCSRYTDQFKVLESVRFVVLDGTLYFPKWDAVLLMVVPFLNTFPSLNLIRIKLPWYLKRLMPGEDIELTKALVEIKDALKEYHESLELYLWTGYILELRVTSRQRI
ncbi:hypothetical protein BDR26DRAFT_850041 [Obelidium mucronatum]|nr:hypothetical protein BDR26DRAFT_850041 [Obelidium mucronatum]